MGKGLTGMCRRATKSGEFSESTQNKNTFRYDFGVGEFFRIAENLVT